MSPPVHSNVTYREPEARPVAVPLRLAAEPRRAGGEVPAEGRPLFTAGDRLAVSSELTEPSTGPLRPILFTLLLLLAGIGAATIFRMLTATI